MVLTIFTPKYNVGEVLPELIFLDDNDNEFNRLIGEQDINNIINSVTQEILLDKASVQEILDKASEDWKNIEE